MTSSPGSSTSTMARSAPRSTCPLAGRRTPATATAKLGCRFSMSFRNGSPCILTTPGTCSVRRSIRTEAISPLASTSFYAVRRVAHAIPSAIWRGLVVMGVLLALQPPPVRAAVQPITIHADVATAREGGQVLEAVGHVVLSDSATTLRADYALYMRREGHIRLAGHVHIATVQGELSSDRATSKLGRKGQIETIEATGAVMVRSADRTVRADRVTYQTKDQTLTAI